LQVIDEVRKTVLLLCLCLVPILAQGAPLGLDWKKEYTVFEPPIGFRYYLGDIDWGELVFVGTEDLLGAETELQLFFVKERIAKAVLILGAEGIDTHNCILKYKTVVLSLNKNYGNFRYEQLEKDPLMDELIHMSACAPVQMGMLRIKNIWSSKGFIIYSTLIGDEYGFYVEIEYIVRSLRKIHRQIKKDKILKRL
jgi:hypothetical protein